MTQGEELNFGLEESRLTVLLDLRHPMAYLALHPTIEFSKLAASLGTEVNWLPVRVPPLRPPTTPGPEDDRGLRHRRHRAHAIAREVEVYAEAQGLMMKAYYRDADPTAAYSAWLWFRENEPERLRPFLTELFRAYWSLEIDPAEPAAVGAIIDAQGGNGSGFLDFHRDVGEARVAHLEEVLSSHGLAGTPLYRLDDEIFLGRQHLPMLRWLLEGRPGPGPI